MHSPKQENKGQDKEDFPKKLITENEQTNF